MAKIENITVVVKADENGNLVVRYVGAMGDGSHKHGEEKNLNAGDVNSLKAVVNKIVNKLEAS
jgi:hypothetical protein